MLINKQLGFFSLYTQAPITCAVITHGHPMGRLSASTFEDTTTDWLKGCVGIEESYLEVGNKHNIFCKMAEETTLFGVSAIIKCLE